MGPLDIAFTKVVDRGGKRTRVGCGYCGVLIEVKTAREKKCGSTCRACLDRLLVTITADYRSQMDRRVPKGSRYVLIPMGNFVPLRFGNEVRDVICAIDPPRPVVEIAKERTA